MTDNLKKITSIQFLGELTRVHTLQRECGTCVIQPVLKNKKYTVKKKKKLENNLFSMFLKK